ncbi:MAG: hypothetical protein UX65_C0004G0039 [Parcubacteria group bacterium GW2011_GWB1_46_8]|nr:MAG: hypothetical protein UX15_C0035G0002 [Parcubacteria group bacterium GW2011_GWA1_45_7]KKU11143.1 MAG: hypothetical protein UX14_C0002G0007 [Parcubacteria group bacterium GW2011_GWF1_45_5]KKU44273.1 MAG: hypothetical protein UX61_C0003G0002 [Parcubacteria group bacterium GW2011_GWA2_46_7]KKU46393.1 MAG: hypothetical protein UX65_C0004G0039 [Parcubacteria group bacterium GW2011_GWB1_46_8]KKU47943.1 MAG: hypothetical protein UX66_C0002G0002 [Parcubacteria group bacterium GW2011_GWF2_46_8]
MKITERLQQMRKLPKAKREKVHQTIIWIIIPFVILIWAVSFAGILRQVSNPQASPPPALGERVVQGISLFSGQLFLGLNKIYVAGGDFIGAMNISEVFYGWWRRILGKPVVLPLESTIPVFLPIVSPSPAL